MNTRKRKVIKSTIVTDISNEMMVWNHIFLHNSRHNFIDESIFVDDFKVLIFTSRYLQRLYAFYVIPKLIDNLSKRSVGTRTYMNAWKLILPLKESEKRFQGFKLEDITSEESEDIYDIYKNLRSTLSARIFWVSCRRCDRMARTHGCPHHSPSAPTQFWDAVKRGDIERVQYYFDNYVSPKATDSEWGENCLYLACYSGNIALVKYLVNEKNIDEGYGSKFKSNLLHSASSGGDLNVLKFLLSKKFNYREKINDKTENGMTPLHSAASSNSLLCVKYLLEMGADKTIQTIDGEIPYDLTTKANIRKLLKVD
eukprot:TRINITY_DN1243_c0_g1_i6.p1 TRINITY_DN1243_c0_g1~~TRINITY_DN1243_c0_g1_i6.p1  ORF type:complete len:312 (-),score=28.25 TRINITY_DN1243_c0_g1_i6:27-962(-)